MRIRYALTLAALAILPILAQTPGAQRPAGADWPMYNRDLRRNTLFAADADRHHQRRKAHEGLVLSTAARKRKHQLLRPALASEIFNEVTPIVVNGVMYMPSGNRVVALEPETGKEIWSYPLTSGPGIIPRRGLLAWRRSAPSAHSFHFSQKVDRSERTAPERWTQHSESTVKSRSRTSLHRRSAGLQEHDLHRRDDLRPRRTASRCGHLHCNGTADESRSLRRAKRRQAVGVPFHSAARRIRQRHVAQRKLERQDRPERLGVHPDDGRAARHRLSPDRRPQQQLLRRKSSGRQPVFQFAGRRKYGNRQTYLALPDGPPRSVGLRSAARRPCSSIS